jgi:hypothetical protein
MERAKRLELIRSLVQACLGNEAYQILKGRDAHGHAHEKNEQSADGKLAVWTEELDEVLHAWPRIESKVQAGVMAIVRSQKIAPPCL